jgi:predicted O-linked N-acetylglucosamine transferase (SPINDLY family)
MLNVTTGSAEVFKRVGAGLYAQGRMEEALRAFERVTQLEPGNGKARHNVGAALVGLQRFEEALPHFRRALELEPGLAIAHNSLGAALLETGDAAGAVAALRRGVAVAPGAAGMHSFLICALAHAGATEAEIAAETAAYGRRFPAVERPAVVPAEGRALRVGYVSGDLRDHAVTWFFEPVLRAHDRGRVEIFVYCHNAADGVTERLRGLVANWRDIGALTDAQAAEAIRNDRVDVLVDLMGHTAGNRLPLFALRPAPVQVSWLGYAGPTPLPVMDATLSDGVVDPSAARLPVLAPYAPPPFFPETRRGAGPLTLGSLGNPVKLAAATVAAWGRILEALPEARLLLIVPGPRVERVRRSFAEGVRGRLVFREKLSLEGYFALHNEIDILLDTFPLSGHTVTCHALVMGVPVVTVAGPTAWGRLSAGVLAALGRREWIARDAEEYVGKVVGLARGLPRREEVRRAFLASPVTDARGFTAAMEEALRELHGSLAKG